MTLIQKIIQKTRELLRLEEHQASKPPPAPKPRPQPPKPKPAPKKPKEPQAPRHLEGIDYSEGNGITAKQIKEAGKRFVCRYLSEEGNPKNIDKQEVWNLLNAKLAIVVVWETTAKRMLSGKLGGIADAFSAKQEVERLGLGQIPIYFAADFDATEANQGPINAYLDGAAQAIGKRRVGIYGGYWPVKRAFDANKTTYGWQTYAWSGGKWDPRAQLQQYENGGHLHQAEVDLDRSTRVDYGQWPRP